MSNLIRIGDRLINLNQIILADREVKDGAVSVTVLFEPQKSYHVPISVDDLLNNKVYPRPERKGTTENPVVHPINMRLKAKMQTTFGPSYARYRKNGICRVLRPLP